jgi:hypothetical protein
MSSEANPSEELLLVYAQRYKKTTQVLFFFSVHILL